MTKEEIIKYFSINKDQEILIQKYLEFLSDYNSHTNLVGKSTLYNPWLSHILDSLQILPLIKDKNSSVLDMGSGAGFPGVVLKICGSKKVVLIDSNGKKINFLNIINEKLDLDLITILGRLESTNNLKFDVITARGLASLDKLFTYSQKFIKKNTVLIFLKGKTVNEEINDVKKKWNFNFKKIQSLSDKRGCVLLIKNIKKND